MSCSVAYGEFMYQAGSWDYPRRVVCKVEKRAGQLVHMFTFIVTNMDSSPKDLIRFYCKRGAMENFIKESKNGFDFASLSSSSKAVNANRLQVHALAYNIFNWFKRLALSAKMRKQQIDTIRLKLLKIAAKWYVQQDILYSDFAVVVQTKMNSMKHWKTSGIYSRSWNNNSHEP